MDKNSGSASPTGNALQLALATGAFAVCFAVFGSVSAMMPIMRKSLGLSPIQVSIAVAIPVLLGSLGRIPLGMLTDKYGGRLIFSIVMAFAVVPAVLMGWVGSYWQLLLCGFFIGIALASFSVGVGFSSAWYPPAKQGLALGVYGAGNVGQSMAAFGSPLLAASLGFKWGFWTFAIILLVWLVLFMTLARNAPRQVPAKSIKDMLAPLRESKSWVLSLYYFLTFGGFVAMSIYLPTFLTEMFKLTPQDAGLRTAGFVLLATAMRPVGGMLADKIGGLTILKWVFPITAMMAIFMACPLMSTFTIGALGMAAAIGLGNGAVFKLVPEYFPNAVGSVTGLVGAAGGLGGFFPPLVVGSVKQMTGAFTLGFVFLAMFAVICLIVARKTSSTTKLLPAHAV
ncbi:MAG: NarK/NasA family nitrate transporter [Acidobacteria bacterium]|nr:NarK/NasA family nitrate transporter [Acidobacteriota bacterium]